MGMKTREESKTGKERKEEGNRLDQGRRREEKGKRRERRTYLHVMMFIFRSSCSWKGRKVKNDQFGIR